MGVSISIRWMVAALVIAGAGCGDDGGAAPQQAQAARPGLSATPGAVVGGPGNKNKLVEKLHIEDRVSCPVPEQPSDPKDGKCDPKAPGCGEHLYCLALAQGNYCEPCPERDGIRHAFRDRDFDGEHNRDPFQATSSLVGTGGGTHPDLKKCRTEEQLIATNYSYADLKLVGIVAQGTQRKVLMMGGPLGYIIKRGDCVGKEKAFVKDIGTGYITFQLDPDEYSVQLNPKQLVVNEPELPSPAPRTTITPVVPPPAVLPSRGQGQGAGPGTAAGSAAPAAGSAAPAAGSGAAPAAPPAPPAEAPPPAKKR
jgi:hypothetical protein